MKLSIEISTYNRKDVLRLILQKLALQTYPFDHFEVVISDDGSDDGTDRVVESMKNLMPYKISFITHDHYGPGSTHNMGIKEAKGEIILMLADDILPEPQLLMEHMKSHDQYPGPSVVVAGQLRQSPELTKTVAQMSWDPILNDLFSNERKDLKHGGFLVSNLSFKKSFMIKHGLFQSWPPASHEDLELGYRLKQNGMILVSNRKALGLHHHAETLESVSARSHMHGYNWHYFEENVPSLWIRCHSGNVRLDDGIGVYAKNFIMKSFREILINHFTVTNIMQPLIRKAEDFPKLRFMVPLFIGKVASYYFHRGLSDYKKNLRMNT